jgi:NADH-quinone oxidoreductase subunit F
MTRIFKHLEDGTATKEDVDLLDSVAQSIVGKCLCALGDFAAAQVVADIARFRADFDARAMDGK